MQVYREKLNIFFISPFVQFACNNISIAKEKFITKVLNTANFTNYFIIFFYTITDSPIYIVSLNHRYYHLSPPVRLNSSPKYFRYLLAKIFRMKSTLQHCISKIRAIESSKASVKLFSFLLGKLFCHSLTR